MVASKGAGFISRNPDAFDGPNGLTGVAPYNFHRVTPADATLSHLLVSSLQEKLGTEHVREGLNVTADSFYSSQGRIDDRFNDANVSVIGDILKAYPEAQSMEMETFQLFQLAHCSKVPIYASAAAIALANRITNQVIDGGVVEKLEADGGRAVLQALTSFEFPK